MGGTRNRRKGGGKGKGLTTTDEAKEGLGSTLLKKRGFGKRSHRPRKDATLIVRGVNSKKKPSSGTPLHRAVAEEGVADALTPEKARAS